MYVISYSTDALFLGVTLFFFFKRILKIIDTTANKPPQAKQISEMILINSFDIILTYKVLISIAEMLSFSILCLFSSIKSSMLFFIVNSSHILDGSNV